RSADLGFVACDFDVAVCGSRCDVVYAGGDFYKLIFFEAAGGFSYNRECSREYLQEHYFKLLVSFLLQLVNLSKYLLLFVDIEFGVVSYLFMKASEFFINFFEFLTNYLLKSGCFVPELVVPKAF